MNASSSRLYIGPRHSLVGMRKRVANKCDISLCLQSRTNSGTKLNAESVVHTYL